jgi:tRNA pseudouridine13 synthase
MELGVGRGRESFLVNRTKLGSAVQKKDSRPRHFIASELSQKVISREYGFDHTDDVKLKRLPEDFRVEELTDLRPSDAGEYAMYRLEKRGLGTLEAIDAVSRRWKLAQGQVAFGGLKDRHAECIQYLTIRRGPRRGLHQTNLELVYLGQVSQPYTSDAVAGNRFQIVIRSLSADHVVLAEETLQQITHQGLPNYFDDQRFGSVGQSGEFVARAWIAGDYERTIWLALADANPLDRSNDRDEKRLLRERWGDWSDCLQHMRSTQRRGVVQFLQRRPSDFRGALTRIRHELRSLYIAAFQSHLWNRLLAALLERSCQPHQLVAVSLKTGSVPFFIELGEDDRAKLQHVQLPLPSSRIKLDDGPLGSLVADSLAEIGLTMREIRIKYPRDSFFSKGWRQALFYVKNLEYDSAADDLYPGRQTLRVRFDLPRGSYATILIKRIALAIGGCAVDSVADDVESESGEEQAGTA